jgi:hypothetical protein
MCTALLPGRAYEHQSLKGKTKQYIIIIYIYITTWYRTVILDDSECTARCFIIYERINMLFLII